MADEASDSRSTGGDVRVPPPPVVAPPDRSAGRDSAALTAGTVLSLLAAYGYVVVGTRYLGADVFAPISVLWTFWALTTAVMTFPVQHWITRTIRADGSEATARRAMPTILWTTLALAGLCAIVTMPVRRSLFQRDDVWFPLLTALVPAGSVAMGIVRGVLAGREQFFDAGASIAGENLVRLVGAALVVLVGGGAVAFGMMLVAGFAVGLCWLSPLRVRDGTDAHDGQESEKSHDGKESERSIASHELTSPLRFLAAVGGGAVISQLVLYGAPVAVALLGGAPRQVTAVFAVMALCRVPYALAVGLSTQLTGILTGYFIDGHEDRLRRVRLLTVAGSAVGAAVAAVAGRTLLQPIATLVFGRDARLPEAVMAVLAAASAVAVGTLVYTIILVARARSGAVAAAWAVALAGGLALLALLPGTPVSRVAWAFLSGEVAALVAMVVAERSDSFSRVPDPAGR